MAKKKAEQLIPDEIRAMSDEALESELEALLRYPNPDFDALIEARDEAQKAVDDYMNRRLALQRENLRRLENKAAERTQE